MRANADANTNTNAVAGASLAHTLVATRARVVSRGGVDVYRAWGAAPDQAGFLAQPLLQQAGALYAATMSRMQQRDFAAARSSAARLAALIAPMGDATSARLAQLLRVEVEVAAGDGAAAARLPGLAGGTSPLLRRPELVYAAEAALAGGGPLRRSIDQLQTWVALNPRDGTAWELLARAYRADGQAMRALRAEAEVQVAHLDWAGAVDRFKAGQALMRTGGSSDDYVEASIIDTRLTEAESRLRAQKEAAKR